MQAELIPLLVWTIVSLALKKDGDVNGTVMHIVKTFMNIYNIKPYDEKTHKGLVRHVLLELVLLQMR